MVNWKNKYLDMKLKYINAKNKLKQKGGVGDSLYIVQLGNKDNVLSILYPTSSTYKYRPEINLDIIKYHTTYTVARLMKYWMDTYDTIIAEVRKRMTVSEDQAASLFNILETIYNESNKNPNGIWVVERGDADGPIVIDGEIIHAPFTSLDEIDAQPNPAAFCEDCHTQFTSRNKLFKHYKDNKCPNC